MPFIVTVHKNSFLDNGDTRLFDNAGCEKLQKCGKLIKKCLHVTIKVLYFVHREQKHKKVWFLLETVEIQIQCSSLEEQVH